MARILTVEDEENLRFSIRQALKRAGHEVAEADSVRAASDLLEGTDFDAVLTDVNLGGEDGISLVKKLRADGFEGALVVMTAYGTIESAVSAMKIGADDYIQKPVSLEELVLLIERLLDQRRMRRQLKVYQRLETTRGEPRGLIGESPAWKATVALAERLATAPIAHRQGPGAERAGGALPTVLLLGETGTGKGLLARRIHECGRTTGSRPDGAPEADSTPFIHVNCSALPPSLIESELFGHEKGAFTDAKSARPGLFEMAEGGTIFLDEIGDMPLDLQAKILTVVEDGVFRRVGGTKDRTVCARIIAATNQDLEQRVDAGKFRRDLLYRLNAFTVRIPPLRERAQDSAMIVEAMLGRFAKDYGRPAVRLTPEARDAIARHLWPGNVREVINLAQRLAMLCDRAEVGPSDLGLAGPGISSAVRRAVPLHAAAAPTPNGLAQGLHFDFDHGLHKAEEVERELIVQALQKVKGNVSKAAKLIGMQRSSLRYRIDRFELHQLVQEMASR